MQDKELEFLERKKETMRRIRKERRKAGYTEVSIWVPHEFSQRVKDFACDLRERVARKFPCTRNDL